MPVRISLPWLWLLVGLQLAIPASYYLTREDRDDERFAWRMFSAIRLERCEVVAFDGESGAARRPIELSRALHASWIRSLERGRRTVIEAFLATRCRRPTLDYALLERRCHAPSGRALPSVHYRYECAAQRFEVAR